MYNCTVRFVGASTSVSHHISTCHSYLLYKLDCVDNMTITLEKDIISKFDIYYRYLIYKMKQNELIEEIREEDKTITLVFIKFTKEQRIIRYLVMLLFRFMYRNQNAIVEFNKIVKVYTKINKFKILQYVMMKNNFEFCIGHNIYTIPYNRVNITYEILTFEDALKLTYNRGDITLNNCFKSILKTDNKQFLEYEEKFKNIT
jgi:hypothetical protein